jgi:hypothetical protein
VSSVLIDLQESQMLFVNLLHKALLVPTRVTQASHIQQIKGAIRAVNRYNEQVIFCKLTAHLYTLLSLHLTFVAAVSLLSVFFHSACYACLSTASTSVSTRHLRCR